MSITAPFHKGQESSVEGIRRLDLVRVLAQEKDTLIDQIADNESQDLPKISPGYEFLQSLVNKDKITRRGEYTSKACSPGLLEDSSTIISYFVRGRCSCLNESKAPLNLDVKRRSFKTSTGGYIPIRNL